jgi:hypothetical protein
MMPTGPPVTGFKSDLVRQWVGAVSPDSQTVPADLCAPDGTFSLKNLTPAPKITETSGGLELSRWVRHVLNLMRPLTHSFSYRASDEMHAALVTAFKSSETLKTWADAWLRRNEAYVQSTQATYEAEAANTVQRFRAQFPGQQPKRSNCAFSLTPPLWAVVLLDQLMEAFCAHTEHEAADAFEHWKPIPSNNIGTDLNILLTLAAACTPPKPSVEVLRKLRTKLTTEEQLAYVRRSADVYRVPVDQAPMMEMADYFDASRAAHRSLMGGAAPPASTAASGSAGSASRDADQRPPPDRMARKPRHPGVSAVESGERDPGKRPTNCWYCENDGHRHDTCPLLSAFHTDRRRLTDGPAKEVLERVGPELRRLIQENGNRRQMPLKTVLEAYRKAARSLGHTDSENAMKREMERLRTAASGDRGFRGSGKPGGGAGRGGTGVVLEIQGGGNDRTPGAV